MLDPVRRRAAAPLNGTAGGTVSAMVAVGGLTYGAIEACARGFAASAVVTAGVVAVAASAVFLIRQTRAAHPMLPLDLFRSRAVSGTGAVGFAFVVGYYGLPFVMSLYLQEVRGLSSLSVGVVFLPMMLSGTALTPFSSASVAVWLLSALMVLVGLAGSLVMPPATAVLHSGVPAHRAGTAGGAFQREPSARRCLGDRGLRCPAGCPHRVQAGTAHQPARRRSGRRRRHLRGPAPAVLTHQPTTHQPTTTRSTT